MASSHIKWHVVHSWLTELQRDRGMAVSQMWYSFILLMALHTRILRWAMVCVFSMTSLLKQVPFLNVGILRLAPTSIWSITKPLSVMHTSPGSRNLRIPDGLVISWSDTDPVKSFETKVITPYKEIPIRVLKVVWFSYGEKVSDWSVSGDGDSHLITVQSRITLIFKQYCVNIASIVAWTCSLDIQVGTNPKTRYKYLAHVMMTLLTVVVLMPKMSARNFSFRPTATL